MSERMIETESAERPVSGWAVGLAFFGGIVMIMAGTFGVIAGLAAILEDKFYVVGVEYVFELDVTTWGWIHLLVGILIGIAGLCVLSGQTWARGVGIVCAVVNAIANFMFIPYYPVWSILIIALDIAVIWALAVYSRPAADSRWS